MASKRCENLVMIERWLLFLFIIQFPASSLALVHKGIQRTTALSNTHQLRNKYCLEASPSFSKVKKDRQYLVRDPDLQSRRYLMQDKGKSTSAKQTTIKLQDLSNQGTVESANMAHSILTSLENSDAHPNVLHYSLVIDAFANIGDVTSAKKIIDTMKEQWRDYDIDVFPNSHCFAGLLKAYINEFRNEKSRAVKASTLVKKCEKVLCEMSELYSESGQEDVMPNTVVYNLFLKALTVAAVSMKSQNNKKAILNPLAKSFPVKTSVPIIVVEAYVDKAIDLLSKMEEGFETDQELCYPKPDAYSYCTVITLLAKCVQDKKGAELAESFLTKVKPYDTASYNAVILAWANLGTRYGAERASKLLDKLESSMLDDKISNSGMMKTGSNELTYNTIISAWVKSAALDRNYEYAAEQAELVLRRGLKNCVKFEPNVVSYSSIIDCWSRSGSLGGSKRAQQLLQEMERLYSSGENLAVKPNIITFTSCLMAYARTNSEEGALAANALFSAMKEKYLENDDEDYKVNMVSYFAVIDGWARSNSKEAGKITLRLLHELEALYLKGQKELRPDVRVYARVIAALVKSSNYDEAEKVLGNMEQFARSGDEKVALAKPNVVIYNTLINEYARRRHCKRALRILNQMDRYNSSSESEADTIVADEHTLNGIIYALSVGSGKGKARKALKMLERLENSHINGSWGVKPSTRSYNMVINACANSFKQNEKERLQAVDIALNVYSKLTVSNLVDADRYTYISLLKAFGKLMPAKSKRRQKLVLECFQACCDSGMVCDDILENYILAASPTSLPTEIARIKKMSKHPKLSSSMLPTHWTYRGWQTLRKPAR